MAADTKPMSYHIPVDLKARLEKIAELRDRSLTKQMNAMLKAAADAEEKELGIANPS